MFFELPLNGSGGGAKRWSGWRAANGGLPDSLALLMDSAGNLYGGTEGFGAHDGGVVYELSPVGDGTWTEKPLYSFAAKANGNAPYRLTFDPSGNIYGLSYLSWNDWEGQIFKLSNSGGIWTESVVHRFTIGTSDGTNPEGLTFDAAGNLYVTTFYGGTYYSGGTVLKFTPNGTGGFTKESDLHSFTGGSDGANPSSR